jgi:quercetin dioxygenase-like cupin family protein
MDQAAQAAKVSRTDLHVSPLGERGLEVVGYETRLPEGLLVRPHQHAYSTVGRVLDGIFQLQVGDGPVKDYKAGEIFSEPAGKVVSGKAVTETTLYVVLVREPGTPEARFV